MEKDEEIKKLNDQIAKLEKQLAVRADIVSLSAHQIRTSLSAIKWILKMFTNDELGRLNAGQKNLMEKAYENNDRAISFIGELLLANKAEDIVEKEYSFSKVDINELIEDAVFDLSGEAHTHEVEIIFLKPDNILSRAFVDKEKIRIVLQNLIENAIKYSKKNSKVFISIMEKFGNLEISIRDTGIGISEEGKKRIFEKFYRDENAQKKQAIGSGIGLYTAKSIIEKHRGKIWFESIEDEGTTFLFTIPIFTEKK